MDNILKHIPKEQHELAKQYVKFMEELGCQNIGLCAGQEEPPDVTDLAGVFPDSPYMKFFCHTEHYDKINKG